MENKEKKFGALSSSANPQELSMTISSLLRIISYLIGSILAFKGISFAISDDELQQVTNALVAMATAGLTIYQGGQFIVGLFRRAFARK